MRLKQFMFALTAMLLSFASPSFAADNNVAKVGNTEYATIDAAVAAWTNNTTLTLLADVTLSGVVTLSSQEHHYLALGTYTMTAYNGKNAIEIKSYGRADRGERGALTITADAENPGGINAGTKACIYYKYDATLANNNYDRPIIYIKGGVFVGSSYSGIGCTGHNSAQDKCATFDISGGTFNCGLSLTKAKLLISGGTFNYPINCTGGGTSHRQISGGTFKSWTWMTADAPSKFWVGTSQGNYNVGVYVDDNGYLVVGGDVVKEPGNFEASSANYGGWSSYLEYSSAKNNGLYYTSVEEALADNNKTTGSVTVYVDELDMSGISYKGTIVVPAESKITIINAPENLVVKDENGKTLTPNANGTYSTVAPTAKIGDVEYATLAEAVAAAQAGDEIVLLGDVAEDATLPAGVKFNGNGKAVGNLTAGGEITFTGVTKATSFVVEYTNTTVNIVPGASLEITGTNRMAIGHGCTFNITGNIENAKTADVAALTPSLIIPGASFTGAGVTFNVTNAYIKATAYCSSKNNNANGTFNFNVTNSVWEQGNTLVFSAPTNSMDPTFNLNLVNSVLNSTSHLVFAVTKGEIVIDNSNVNVGTARQIENRSTMTIKNGSVVNGAVATSSNAKNPGTLIVEDATYTVTGEFSGSDLGTGTLIVNKGATVSAGSITKANIQIDATGMAAGDEVNLTADLSKLVGTIEVINNDNLDASIVDGKVVLVAVIKPVAKIGDVEYTSLQEAIEAVQEGETVTVLEDITFTTGANGSTNGISYTRGASFTLDLNGKTITSDLGNNALRFKIGDGNTVKDTEVTVLIKNGKIVSGSNNWCAISAATADNSGNKLILNLTDLTIEANKAGDFAVKSWAGAVVNAMNVDVTANYAGGFYAVGGEIVLDENSSVAQKGLHTAPYMSYAFGVSSGTGKMTINGGIYSAVPAATTDADNQGASHGSSVGGVMSSGGTLIINGGTFSNDNFGDAEPTAPRSLIMADAGAVVTINGGTFNAMAKIVDPTNNTGDASKNANVTIKGGTYSADPTDAPYNLVKLAEGYAALQNLDGNYVVGVKPTATVNNLGMTTVKAGDYSIWNGSFDQNTEDDGDMPLSFVMQFLADQDAEDMKTSPYANWYGDFVITFTGIENGSFTADGCYLAGHYGSFGWVKVPVDGMTIEEGARYPVMLGVGLGQKYNYICSSVEDFKCALYLTPEILEANPNIQVKLELAVVDNSKGSDAAASALINNDKVYSVTEYTYDAEDFVAKKDPEVVDGKIEFVDGEFNSYTNDTDVENVEITYKRTIDSDWNALYVPFAIPASELLADFDIAYINDVRETDADDDGELDGWQMELIKIKKETAVLRANHPYFVRSKSADYTENNLSLTLTTTLYKATVAEVICSSAYSFYTIKGLNELRASTEFGDADRVLGYDNGETTWGKMADGYSLKPFRFYLTITNLDGSPVVSSSAQMSIVVRDEDGTTGIDGICGDENGETVIFDLYGRRVLEPEKGNIYIINGKKVLVK